MYSNDIQSFIRTIDDSTSTIKGHFKVSEVEDADKFVLFTINSGIEKVGYFEIDSNYLDGSVTTFSGDTQLAATFARVGDKGDVGNQGIQGVQGLKGEPGEITGSYMGVRVASGNLTVNSGSTIVLVSGVDFSGSLLPSDSGLYDLGSIDLPWRSVYIKGESLHVLGQESNFKIGADEEGINFSTFKYDENNEIISGSENTFLSFKEKGEVQDGIVVGSGGIVNSGTLINKQSIQSSGEVIVENNAFVLNDLSISGTTNTNSFVVTGTNNYSANFSGGVFINGDVESESLKKQMIKYSIILG
tara:strand:- start:889 stop:1794 length:906 start_codon:yes stop_codon:yes gene_type:complete